jgi:hypothetical protein
MKIYTMLKIVFFAIVSIAVVLFTILIVALQTKQNEIVRKDAVGNVAYLSGLVEDYYIKEGKFPTDLSDIEEYRQDALLSKKLVRYELKDGHVVIFYGVSKPNPSRYKELCKSNELVFYKNGAIWCSDYTIIHENKVDDNYALDLKHWELQVKRRK